MNIPLKEWAEKHFDPPPGTRVINGWRKANLIYPPPIKGGHKWYVNEDAKVLPRRPVQSTDPVVREILNGR